MVVILSIAYCSEHLCWNREIGGFRAAAAADSWRVLLHPRGTSNACLSLRAQPHQVAEVPHTRHSRERHQRRTVHKGMDDDAPHVLATWRRNQRSVPPHVARTSLGDMRRHSSIASLEQLAEVRVQAPGVWSACGAVLTGESRRIALPSGLRPWLRLGNLLSALEPSGGWVGWGGYRWRGGAKGGCRARPLVGLRMACDALRAEWGSERARGGARERGACMRRCSGGARGECAARWRRAPVPAIYDDRMMEGRASVDCSAYVPV